MKRTQISLDDEERALLDAESARSGRSMSALIRDAVRVVYAPRDSTHDDITRLREAFGAWDTDHVDGETYVEAVRSGSRWSSLES